ncbi:MAG: glycosyl hydrolase family 28 protein [Bacteroidota bacterium]|nr:glycosyl hydrolase family 28 protein [Bacteroidota bacterium]
MRKLRFISFILLINLFLQAGKAQSVYMAPELPLIPNNSFNITNYGAKSDEVVDNTKAIQDAIDAAAKTGGGHVIIPAGTYLCGPLKIMSNLNLQLDSGAIIKFLPFDRYPGGVAEGNDFIAGAKLHDIAITGKGKIDGQGSPWWPYAKTKGAKRPRMITFKNCDKVLIDHVQLSNSPMFHIAISSSSNITVRGVIIRAPASTDPVNPSHNTDACDVSGKRILIQDCDISVGDDDFTCGGGTSDVLITNCTYGNGHGLSIGSPTHGGVSNFTVENCTFTNTECGIRIKSDRDRGGELKNLTYRNLKMNNVGIPILIYAAYNAKEREYRNLQKLTPEIARTYSSEAVTERTPVYHDITFQNITATVEKGKRAGLIWGLPEANAYNIIFQKVNIKADGPMGIFFAKNVRFENCKIISPEGVNRLSVTNAQVTIDGKEAK